MLSRLTRRSLLAAAGSLAAGFAAGDSTIAARRPAGGVLYSHTFRCGGLHLAAAGDVVRLTVVIDGAASFDGALVMVIRKGIGPVSEFDLQLPHVSRGVWSVRRDPGAAGIWWGYVRVNTEAELDPPDVLCTFELQRGGRTIAVLNDFTHGLDTLA